MMLSMFCPIFTEIMILLFIICVVLCQYNYAIMLLFVTSIILFFVFFV